MGSGKALFHLSGPGKAPKVPAKQFPPGGQKSGKAAVLGGKALFLAPHRPFFGWCFGAEIASSRSSGPAEIAARGSAGTTTHCKPSTLLLRPVAPPSVADALLRLRPRGVPVGLAAGGLRRRLGRRPHPQAPPQPQDGTRRARRVRDDGGQLHARAPPRLGALRLQTLHGPPERRPFQRHDRLPHRAVRPSARPPPPPHCPDWP